MPTKGSPIIRSRWSRAFLVVPAAVLTLATPACVDAKDVDTGAATTGVSPAVANPAGLKPVPAPTRPPLSASERARATAAWPAIRSIIKADLAIRWIDGPRFVGHARTKSDEWVKSGAILPLDPKAAQAGLATRPLPEFYDVWVVRGEGVWDCSGSGDKCTVTAAQPIHRAYVFDSDGQLYERVTWDGEQAPYDIASVGLPAEEFNLD